MSKYRWTNTSLVRVYSHQAKAEAGAKAKKEDQRIGDKHQLRVLFLLGVNWP